MDKQDLEKCDSVQVKNNTKETSAIVCTPLKQQAVDDNTSRGRNSCHYTNIWRWLSFRHAGVVSPINFKRTNQDFEIEVGTAEAHEGFHQSLRVCRNRTCKSQRDYTTTTRGKNKPESVTHMKTRKVKHSVGPSETEGKPRQQKHDQDPEHSVRPRDAAAARGTTPGKWLRLRRKCGAEPRQTRLEYVSENRQLTAKAACMDSE